MATRIQFRRGTTSEHGSFTGAEGEVTVNTTKDTLVVHDGSTTGGRELARADLDNVSANDLLTKIKTADGASSGLDADLLDGQSSAYFRINVYDAAGNLLN